MNLKLRMALLASVGIGFLTFLAYTQLVQTTTLAVVPIGLIAFHADVNRDGHWEIYIMRPDGTGLSRLTDNSKNGFGASVEPRWSPDAQHILYTDTSGSGIFVMDADGSNPHKLVSVHAVNHSATWSPDGKHITFLSAQSDKLLIYLTDINGTSPLQLTPDDWSIGSQPAWSPDSKRIAFLHLVKHNPEQWGVYLIDVAGGQPKLIQAFEQPISPNFSLEWSPDGTQLAFSAQESGLFHIYVLELSSNALRKLVDGLGPTWSPDSTQIAYMTGLGIYIANADGSGNPRLVAPTHGAGSGPSWSYVTPSLILPLTRLPTFTPAPTATP